MRVNPRRLRTSVKLKIRVIPKRRMRGRDIMAKVVYAAEHGVIPDDIEIRWIDWQRGEAFGSGNRIRPGGEEQALKDFLVLMRQSRIRFGRAY